LFVLALSNLQEFTKIAFIADRVHVQSGSRNSRRIWRGRTHALDLGLDPFTLMQQFATRLACADSIPSALEISRAYLTSWTHERISAVQTEDEGCAPFDRFGKPVSLHALQEVVAVSRALRARCEALRASGIAPTLHLAELDRFFLLAGAVLVELNALTISACGEIHALPARTWAVRGGVPVR